MGISPHFLKADLGLYFLKVDSSPHFLKVGPNPYFLKTYIDLLVHYKMI
jgi:hypothetical protein